MSRSCQNCHAVLMFTMIYRIGFIIEQTLGHLTHQANLVAAVASDPEVRPQWLPIPYAQSDRWSPLPIIGRNWSLTLSLRARSQVASHVERADALFFHTQVTALFSLGLMRKIPSIVSLDATPVNRLNVEAPAAPMSPGAQRIARLKRLWLAATLRSAAFVVAWSRWCAQSVINDYGVPRERVCVVPPGVDLNAYQPRTRDEKQRPLPRVLFVGGDFFRKGGAQLLEVMRNQLRGRCEMDIVTNENGISSEQGVRIHRGISPNSQAIRSLYANADIFVLPTFHDFTPLSILEAMASGLPVVSTDVGAIREQVIAGETGLLIPPPRDGRALSEALRSLVDDPALRHRMGAAGRLRAEAAFDAGENYGRLLGLLKTCAMGRAAGRAGRREPHHKIEPGIADYAGNHQG
jgi:glycosyltransferase involved in cell wall biosynthesis